MMILRFQLRSNPAPRKATKDYTNLTVCKPTQLRSRSAKCRRLTRFLTIWATRPSLEPSNLACSSSNTKNTLRCRSRIENSTQRRRSNALTRIATKPLSIGASWFYTREPTPATNPSSARSAIRGSSLKVTRKTTSVDIWTSSCSSVLDAKYSSTDPTSLRSMSKPAVTQKQSNANNHNLRHVVKPNKNDHYMLRLVS